MKGLDRVTYFNSYDLKTSTVVISTGDFFLSLEKYLRSNQLQKPKYIVLFDRYELIFSGYVCVP